MTIQHQSFVELATDLISENGRAMQLIEMSASDDWDDNGTPTITDVIAVQSKFSFGDFNNTLIETGDVKFLMDSSVEPKSKMKLFDSLTGITYSIENVDLIAPGQTRIMYKIQARI